MNITEFPSDLFMSPDVFSVGELVELILENKTGELNFIASPPIKNVSEYIASRVYYRADFKDFIKTGYKDNVIKIAEKAPNADVLKLLIERTDLDESTIAELCSRNEKSHALFIEAPSISNKAAFGFVKKRLTSENLHTFAKRSDAKLSQLLTLDEILKETKFSKRLVKRSDMSPALIIDMILSRKGWQNDRDEIANEALERFDFIRYLYTCDLSTIKKLVSVSETYNLWRIISRRSDISPECLEEMINAIYGHGNYEGKIWRVAIERKDFPLNSAIEKTILLDTHLAKESLETRKDFKEFVKTKTFDEVLPILEKLKHNTFWRWFFERGDVPLHLAYSCLNMENQYKYIDKYVNDYPSKVDLLLFAKTNVNPTFITAVIKRSDVSIPEIIDIIIATKSSDHTWKAIHDFKKKEMKEYFEKAKVLDLLVYKDSISDYKFWCNAVNTSCGSGSQILKLARMLNSELVWISASVRSLPARNYLAKGNIKQITNLLLGSKYTKDAWQLIFNREDVDVMKFITLAKKTGDVGLWQGIYKYGIF